MKTRKLIGLVMALVAVCVIATPSADTYAKKTTSTQSSKNSKNSKSTKNTKNTKNNKNSSNNKKSKNTKNNKNSKNTNNTKKSNNRRGKTSTSKSSWSNTRKASTQKAAAPKETVSNDSLTLLINDALKEMVTSDVDPGNLRVNLAKPEASSHRLKVQLNENFTYLPLNREMINEMERTVKQALPDSISNYSVSLNVGTQPLTYYISTIDKLPPQHRQNIPFVVAADPYINPKKGMEGDIIAMWHSHGRYYKAGSGWLWQRPFLFDTAEDIYTMSYVLPFLVPMLENAGAYVMLPRERDFNINEVIVDNDLPFEGEILYSQQGYVETNGSNQWQLGDGEGFIYDVPDFRDTENPFEHGTYRQVNTVSNPSGSSKAVWNATIPEEGEYAVYVSYKTLPNSSEDARYRVNYSGGHRDFIVNQTMGGGTWIYLGTFPLRKGDSPVVELSNLTSKGGNTVVTADAVKIGGGKGNIARSPKRSDVFWDDEDEPVEEVASQEINEEDTQGMDDNADRNTEDASEGNTQTQRKQSTKSKGPAPKFSTSGLPRFLEGARYWLHWAGIPESVYSPFHGTDDYKDDYTSRGHWVNWLAGGSRVLPNQKGLNIPVDLSFALHTDAGKRSDESIVGTLGIYYTDGGRSYADGTPRINSRILTDRIMRQVTGDIRQTYEPKWTRRQMWDKSYLEARVAQVPTTLLELLSHQNYGDMKYGLDPTFRFTVSRAIYKAMGRFIAERKDREFIVQPLPVKAFAVAKEKKNVFRLSWQPTTDPIEPTAKPSKYIIMERTEGNLGFNKVGETKDTHFDITVKDNKIHSVYVIAANEGGLSFSSEILAFKEGSSNTKPVLIVNGFTRVSGPANFNENGRAGFLAEEDFGVPYKYDISFSGYQQEFSKSAGDRFGKSGSNHVSTVVGGNTFDYPAVHGHAIAAAGLGFVSASALAVEEGKVKLNDYSAVDLILGKQKRTITGGGKSGVRFEAFPNKLREKLEAYLSKGGRLLISGQNLVTELYDVRSHKDTKKFAQETLGLEDSSSSKSHSGRVKVSGLGGSAEYATIAYSNSLRKDNYIVESADILIPSENADATPFLTFSDTGDAAGMLVRNGKSRSVLMTIPFETITDASQREKLMASILNWLEIQ